jgi:hypothetical protein
MDAIAVHRDAESFRYVLHDAHGLKLGTDCNPVHGSGDHGAQIGDFDFSGPAAAALHAEFQQLANSDGGGTHVPREAVNLGLGKVGTDEYLRTTADGRQGIAQIMEE